MRLSTGYWQTLKETPNDAEVVSQQLMMRVPSGQHSGGGAVDRCAQRVQLGFGANDLGVRAG